jgi:diacylglycerol kinase (ATP)
VTIALVANPAAGRGRGARAIARAESALANVGSVRVFPTRGPGDERARALEAAETGARCIAVLGGDGTWGNAAGALAARGVTTPVALLAGGTGNDFAKSIDLPAADYPAVARLVAEGATRRVDLGAVDDRPFLNCAGFGFDAVVCEALATPTRLRGPVVYVATALRELLVYRGLDVAIDGAERARRLMLVFSNGRWFGGTFRIAPAADVGDGRLDVSVYGDVRGLARVPLFARAMRGAHLDHPAVTAWRAEETRLLFDAPPVFEADGEFARAAGREVVVRTWPAALTLVAPPAPVART